MDLRHVLVALAVIMLLTLWGAWRTLPRTRLEWAGCLAYLAQEARRLAALPYDALLRMPPRTEVPTPARLPRLRAHIRRETTANGAIRVVLAVRRPRVGDLLGSVEVAGFVKHRDGRVEHLDEELAAQGPIGRADARAWMVGAVPLQRRTPSVPITSRVVDARTRQPIPEAVVLAVWTNADLLAGCTGSLTPRVVASETVSDAQGRFWLERPLGFVGAVDERVTVYKSGYVAWNNRFTFPHLWRRADTGTPEQIALKLFPARRDPRQHLDFVTLASRCLLAPSEQTPQFHATLHPDARTP